MDAKDWISRCTMRLRRQWPTLAFEDLEEVAAELWNEDCWRSLQPEIAAVQWLRLGVLVD